MNQESSSSPALLSGRIIAVAAGAQMFVLSVYWQMTFTPAPEVAADAAWHPFFVAIALVGLLIVATGVSRRPARLLAVAPIGAPVGLYCLAGEGPVKWRGYSFLLALLGTALVYHGCKGQKARGTVRGVVR